MASTLCNRMKAVRTARRASSLCMRNTTTTTVTVTTTDKSSLHGCRLSGWASTTGSYRRIKKNSPRPPSELLVGLGTTTITMTTTVTATLTDKTSQHGCRLNRWASKTGSQANVNVNSNSTKIWQATTDRSSLQLGARAESNYRRLPLP